MSGMLEVSAESDIASVEEEVKALGLYMPTISRKILARIASKGRAKIRKAYKSSGIKTASGALYKAIFASAKENEVAYFGISSRMHYKFIPLNYGADFWAKHGEFLTFKDASGAWHKVRSVHIPARNFFDSVKSYVGSPEYEADIAGVVDREVAKMFKA